MTADDLDEAALRASGLASRRARLAGAAQGWLTDCRAAVAAGPEATRTLLAAGGEDTRAFEASPRLWPRGEAVHAAGSTDGLADDGLDDDGLEEAAAALTDDSPDLAAARAIASVAQALSGTMPPREALDQAVRHWTRANLPGFDGPVDESRGRFPGTTYTRADDTTRGWLASVSTEPGIPCRGFLGLLAFELRGGGLPVRHEVTTSVLFDRRFDGASGRLRIAVRRRGPAGLFPDPARMAFLVTDDAFHEAARRAWAASALATSGHCIVWSVLDGEEPCVDLAGGSLGAAFAVGLRELDRRLSHGPRRLAPRALQPSTAVTGGLSADGSRLEPVVGYAAKLDAARTANVRLVVVPAPSLTAFDRFRAPTDAFDLKGATTVDEAARLARTRISRQFVALTAAPILLLIAGLSVWLVARGADARHQAESARSAASIAMATASNAARATDARLALQLGAAAYALNPGGPQPQASLVDTIANTDYAAVSFAGQNGQVDAVAFSPDGHTLATAGKDGGVILWDMTNRAKPIPIGQPLRGTGGAAVFSPDGRTLATGGKDGGVILWDMANRAKPIPIGQPSTATYGSLAFSPDGRTLATGDKGGGVVLWDMTNHAKLTPIGQLSGESEGPVAFSPDGRTLAIGEGSIDDGGAISEGTVDLWDLTDRTKPVQIGYPLTGYGGPVNAVAFSSDGQILATGSHDGAAILWDVTERTKPVQIGQPLTGFTGPVNAVAFSPDGNTLAAGSHADTAILWDLTDRRIPVRIGQPAIGHTDTVYSSAFSPDGHTLATGGENGLIILWDLSNHNQAVAIGQPLSLSPSYIVDAVAVSPDGHTLATGGGNIDRDGLPGAAVLWDLTDRAKPVRIGPPLDGDTAIVESVAFSPDGRTLATGGDDGAVVLWDITDRTKPVRIGQPLFADGTGSALTDTSAVFSIAFSPDGHTLVTGGGELDLDIGTHDGSVVLWDLTDRARPIQIGRPITGHSGPVYTVAFSPEGRTLATGDDDGEVVLWDLADRAKPVRTGQPLIAYTGSVTSVAFSPDGRTVAVGSNNDPVVLWDLRNQNRPVRIGQLLPPGSTGIVYTVAFSPDGHTLATGTRTGTVVLWDLTDPAEPFRIGQPLTGHTDTVYSVAFSPDGHTLATGGGDHTAHLWDLTPLAELRADPLRVACQRGAGGLPVETWNLYAPGLAYRDPC
jgi:WD40 repeat protein